MSDVRIKINAHKRKDTMQALPAFLYCSKRWKVGQGLGSRLLVVVKPAW